MAFLLNGTTIARPSSMSRQFVFVKKDFVNLNGRTTRDFSAKKEEFILQFEYLTQAQITTITGIVALNRAVTFQVSETNMTINSALVFPFIKRREYRMPGGSFMETIQLTLIEQS